MEINYNINPAYLHSRFAVGSFSSPIDVTDTREYGVELHYYGKDYNVTGIRSRAQLIETDTTAQCQGGLFQAANNNGIDVGVLNGLVAEAIGKSSANAATIAVMRGALIGAEWGALDAVTTLNTLHVRIHSRNSAGAGSFGTGYGIYLENEAVGGNGQALDAGIYFKDTNISGGNNAFTYGIDFSGGTYTTAEIRGSNGEIISNLTDGSWNFSSATLLAAGATLSNSSGGTIVTISSTSDATNSEVVIQSNRYTTLYVDAYRTAGAYAGQTFRRARGTIASPTIIADNDEIGFFFAKGYDGSQFRNSCGILFAVDGTPTADTSVPGEMKFYTTPAGSSTWGDPRITISSAGVVTIGDTTDYTQIANGTQTLHGAARVIRELWVDAGGIKAPGAKPATAVAHGLLETPAWRFANQGVQANEETISFNLKVPPDMDRSVAPILCLGWSTTAIVGVVEWQLEYLYTKVNENTAAAAEETLYTDDSASGNAEGLISSQFSGIDLPDADDVCMHCRVKRLSSATANGGAESDTVADDVELHGVVFIYTANKLGTAV